MLGQGRRTPMKERDSILAGLRRSRSFEIEDGNSLTAVGFWKTCTMNIESSGDAQIGVPADSCTPAVRD